MRVSVVVPLYNKAPHVRSALDSIAAQTFTDFEVLVIDDGSTDRGGEIAAAYPDRRFAVFSQPNAGPGAARNTGIRQARGSPVPRAAAVRRWGDFHEKPLPVCRGRGALAEGSIERSRVFPTPAADPLSPRVFRFQPHGPRAPRRAVSGRSGRCRAGCPKRLRPLLDRFLTVRACKTAAVLGYWGRWREARALVRQFVSPRDWRLPLFLAALAGCTPLAGIAGAPWRGLRPAPAVPPAAGTPFPEPETAARRAAAAGK